MKPHPTKKEIQCRLTESGCFEVISHPFRRGYAMAFLPDIPNATAEKKQIGIHRYVYALHHGSVPKGKVVMHSCDNPSCINPAHLSLGSTADNMADKVAKGRQVKGETCGRSKVTEDVARAILSDTSTHKEIAKKFGLCRSQVTKIKSGVSWKHLTIHVR